MLVNQEDFLEKFMEKFVQVKPENILVQDERKNNKGVITSKRLSEILRK